MPPINLNPPDFQGPRSRSPLGTPAEPPVPPHDQIHFPRVFEDAWGTTDSAGDNRTDMERARIFLLRFAKMNADPQLRQQIEQLVYNPEIRSIPSLALYIKDRLFNNHHATFSATPLLQCTRFILIKARVTEYVSTEFHRIAVDFFFDPSLERSTLPPPPNPVIHRYPSGRLKVAIIGGGPTALASAISLAEKGAGKVEVHMFEGRWVLIRNPDGSTRMDYPPNARRRDQVVTLQDNVTSLLSAESQHALFQGRPEPVWPASANIQIRKVEDRFLQRCQDPDFHGLIHLYAQKVTRDELSMMGDFHVLLGADGASSWVRQNYFHGYENERGRSYALGLAFDRPEGLPWTQPLNVILTLGQTRYLLNASDHDGRGYLNMQLTDEEWEEMKDMDGNYVHFGNPGCLRRADGSIPEGFSERQVFRPSENRDSTLWRSISDGLKLFGFKEHEVINVVRIPIVVQAVREGVQVLPIQDSTSITRPHALVAVAGDAAMTVHFWPGRGLNSGIKSGISLGDEIVHALNDGRFVGLPLDAMSRYNDFIMKLQDREHDRRSIPILNQSGSPEMLGWLLSKANGMPTEMAANWLVGAMSQLAERLQRRDDWAFPPLGDVEAQLRIVLNHLQPETLREMAVSFPWPTREMGGAEILPFRATKPEEKQRWLQTVFDNFVKETKKLADVTTIKRDRSPSVANGIPEYRAPSRFEAPRGLSPARMESTLRRSNARKNGVISPGPPERNLAVPGAGMGYRSRSPSIGSMGYATGEPVSPMSPGFAPSRSPSPGPRPGPGYGGGGDGGDPILQRLMSVKRPERSMLADAMSLGVFRADDA